MSKKPPVLSEVIYDLRKLVIKIPIILTDIERAWSMVCIQQPPYNYQAKLYELAGELFIEQLDTGIYNTYYDMFNIDIQNKYKYYIYLRNGLYYNYKINHLFRDVYTYTRQQNLPMISDLLINILNTPIYKNSFYENDFDFKSRECITDKIAEIQDEWSYLIKAQQFLALSRCEQLSNDIIYMINGRMIYNKPSNIIMIKSIGLEESNRFIDTPYKLIMFPQELLDKKNKKLLMKTTEDKRDNFNCLKKRKMIKK